MRVLAALTVAAAALLSAASSSAEVVAFRWGNKEIVAFEAMTGKSTWSYNCDGETNWIQNVKDGFLVGCDGGFLVLLDRATGVAKWRTQLERRAVNVFRAAYDSGYLVSDGGQRVFFVGLDGKFLWAWPRFGN